jgi:hypothetical protein
MENLLDDEKLLLCISVRKSDRKSFNSLVCLVIVENLKSFVIEVHFIFHVFIIGRLRQVLGPLAVDCLRISDV